MKKLEWNERNKNTSKASAFISVTDWQFTPNKKGLFQNVKSLHLLHKDDVRSDYTIQKADVNIFVVR